MSFDSRIFYAHIPFHSGLFTTRIERGEAGGGSRLGCHNATTTCAGSNNMMSTNNGIMAYVLVKFLIRMNKGIGLSGRERKFRNSDCLIGTL